MKVQACCKINIGLDVLRRRADGYHDLETVMYPVRGLCDELEIDRIEGEEVQFAVCGMKVDCPAEENLCVKAWRRMRECYGIGGVRIALHKRIPFGAGLGGGSSDATAVLCAVDRLYGLQLREEELISHAAALGSDTAFFVRSTPQLCTGRGEVMQPCAIDLAGYTLVLVKPDEGVSTREAYAGVRPAVPAVRLLERLAQPVERWQGSVKNDFEPSVFAAHPVIGKIKEWLIDAGAVYASMSGSGSAVYGLFRTEQDATGRLTEKLADLRPYIFDL